MYRVSPRDGVSSIRFAYKIDADNELCLAPIVQISSVPA
jgi:hypothetical protein